MISVLRRVRTQARLRLEQRLLRPKDGNGLWCRYLSSEIILDIFEAASLQFDKCQHITWYRKSVVVAQCRYHTIVALRL
jgi:hypothetical protein